MGIVVYSLLWVMQDFYPQPVILSNLQECSSCGSYRLSLQCRHADKTKACQVCGAKSVVTRYLEPMKILGHSESSPVLF